MRKTFIAIAAAAGLAVFVDAVHAQSPGYGFTHPPYNYDDEYRQNEWGCSEEHRYQPGYHRCSGDEFRPDGKADEDEED